MKTSHRLLSLAVLVLGVLAVSYQNSHAQDSSARPRFLIGLLGGYNFTDYNTDMFSIPGTRPDFYVVDNGTGHGSFAGISGEIPIDNAMENFIILDVFYDAKPGDFSWIANYGVAAGYDTAYYLSASLAYVLIDLGYKLNFWHGKVPNYLGLQVSASFGFASQRNFERTTSVYIGDAPAPISTRQESISIPSAESFRFAVRTEFTYDIPLFSSWLLTPSIGYDAPLTKVDPSLNWRANSLYFGLALQYMFKS